MNAWATDPCQKSCSRARRAFASGQAGMFAQITELAAGSRRSPGGDRRALWCGIGDGATWASPAPQAARRWDAGFDKSVDENARGQVQADPKETPANHRVVVVSSSSRVQGPFGLQQASHKSSCWGALAVER
jgi:hypothetical protein